MTESRTNFCTTTRNRPTCLVFTHLHLCFWYL